MKQLNDIFKSGNAHDITHAIIKIAKLSARWEVYPFELLNYAKTSPLANNTYRHNFFTQTTCIKKLNVCESYLRHKMQKAEEKVLKEQMRSRINNDWEPNPVSMTNMVAPTYPQQSVYPQQPFYSQQIPTGAFFGQNRPQQPEEPLHFFPKVSWFPNGTTHA